MFLGPLYGVLPSASKALLLELCMTTPLPPSDLSSNKYYLLRETSASGNLSKSLPIQSYSQPLSSSFLSLPKLFHVIVSFLASIPL